MVEYLRAVEAGLIPSAAPAPAQPAPSSPSSSAFPGAKPGTVTNNYQRVEGQARGAPQRGVARDTRLPRGPRPYVKQQLHAPSPTPD
jgi:hypothetical protein